MNKSVYAVAISASREVNGVKERYIGVRKEDNKSFLNEIEWDWYPEDSIANLNKFIQKTYDSSSNNQMPLSTTPTTMNRRSKHLRKKKEKTSQSNIKSEENPNLKYIQMMRNDLLFSINVDNPKVESCSKTIHSKFSTNDTNNANKKITKILSCYRNPITRQITWKVKIEENNRTIEIPHVDLILKNKNLFVEYCKSHFADNNFDDNYEPNTLINHE